MILVFKNMNSNTTNNNNNITLLCRLHLFVVSKSPKPTIPQNLPNPRYLKISQIHNASCHTLGIVAFDEYGSCKLVS